MTDDWYRMSAFKIAGKTPRRLVHVQWNGREFDAIIWPNPETGKEQWTSIVNGDRVFFPPAREARQWGPQPDAWRPLEGDAWPEPLPAPLRSPGHRMWTSTMKFLLVEEASNAELAREMESDRADAARGYHHVERFDADKLQWWKDGTLITYKPAGEIEGKMVEGRLMRAVAACEAGYGLTLESKQVGQALADLSTAADRAFNQEDPTSSYGIRFDPLPQDHKDFPEAMRWFTDLNPPHVWHKRRKPWSLNRMQKVLVYRARPVPLSFQDIGNHLSRSGERARQIYKEALECAGKIANAPRGENAEIEKVRERNRAFRIAS